MHRFLSLLGTAALLLAAAPAAAQLPGGDLVPINASRRSFLADVFRDVEATLRDFRASWETDDARATTAWFTDDGALIQGETVLRGRRDIERHFAAMQPTASGFRISTTDFTAAGELAYYAGRFTYLVSPAEGEHRAVTGTFVVVLQKVGRNWRIRSYTEIPDAAPAAG